MYSVWKKGSKSPKMGKLQDFKPFCYTLYTPDTEYDNKIHAEYALNQWHLLPYTQLRDESGFKVGKSTFSDFSEFSHIFPIKMYGNRRVARGAAKSPLNDPKFFQGHIYMICAHYKKK